MTEFDRALHSHRRYNPLSGEWVIVSPRRTQRPWSGSVQAPVDETRASYDADCYLCPENARAGDGGENPDYQRTLVFPNDFAALDQDVPAVSGGSSLFRLEPAEGECRVICFSPDHSLTIGEMSHDEVRTVIDLWRSQTIELEAQYRWVQVFETRGDICGSSNPHPHGQIWASQFVPDEPAKELAHQREYSAVHGSHLLLDYVHEEIERGERIVALNEHWAIVAPYWGYWPYETLVLPRARISSLAELDDSSSDSLARILKIMLTGFTRLFDSPFPYCSGWHSAGPEDASIFQLHAHFYPPLLRSADVPKIPASYELLAGVQRDFTPEYAAGHLRSVMTDLD